MSLSWVLCLCQYRSSWQKQTCLSTINEGLLCSIWISMYLCCYFTEITSRLVYWPTWWIVTIDVLYLCFTNIFVVVYEIKVNWRNVSLPSTDLPPAPGCTSHIYISGKLGMRLCLCFHDPLCIICQVKSFHVFVWLSSLVFDYSCNISDLPV
jgi:hypothetical protein